MGVRPVQAELGAEVTLQLVHAVQRPETWARASISIAGDRVIGSVVQSTFLVTVSHEMIECVIRVRLNGNAGRREKTPFDPGSVDRSESAAETQDSFPPNLRLAALTTSDHLLTRQAIGNLIRRICFFGKSRPKSKSAGHISVSCGKNQSSDLLTCSFSYCTVS
jgi:hypothetical protein